MKKYTKLLIKGLQDGFPSSFGCELNQGPVSVYDLVVCGMLIPSSFILKVMDSNGKGSLFSSRGGRPPLLD